MLDKEFKKGSIEIGYLQRSCDNKNIAHAQIYDHTETRFSIPRQVFLVCHGTTGAAVQNTVTTNNNLYRHADVQYIQVKIDNELYPNLQQNGKFLENQYSRFYQEFISSCRNIGGECSISSKEFRDLYTIFSVNLSQQAEKLNNRVTNFSLRLFRNVVPDVNTNPLNPRELEIFIIILNEKKIKIDVIKQSVEEIN